MKSCPAPILCLSAFILSPALAPAARAQAPTSWSLTGAGCVPTGQTAAGIGTFNSAGDSKFVAGHVGEIILTCPVPSSMPGAVAMSMTYRDPDGRLRSTGVRAVLRQKSLADGAVADVAWARLESNNFGPAPATVRRTVSAPNACNGSFTFDHDRFTYYIQVNITRTLASGDVLLASVDLSRSLIC